MIIALILWLIAGLVARLIVPGRKDVIGFVVAMAAGVAGFFLASAVGAYLGLYARDEGAGLIGSFGGACVILGAWNIFPGGRKVRPTSRIYTAAHYDADDSVVPELEKLASLLASGAIDDAEFAEMKAKVLRK